MESTGKEGCFICLTYSDEYLEEISKITMRKFMKNFRKKSCITGLKFFGCGEHGEESGRPHYHFVIIGWQPSIKDMYVHHYEKGKPIHSSHFIDRCWKKGFNSVGSVTQKSIFYTTGYILKDKKGIRVMSKNLGEEFIEMRRNQLRERWLNGENFGSLILQKIMKDKNPDYIEFLKHLRTQNQIKKEEENYKIKNNLSENEFKSKLSQIAYDEEEKNSDIRYQRYVVSRAKEDQRRRRKL